MQDLKLFSVSGNKSTFKRTDRISSQIREILSLVLTRGDFPVVKDYDRSSLPCPVTITDVDVAPDLHNATIYIMPLLGENKEEVLTFLDKYKFFLKTSLAKKMKIRCVPNLHFSIDKSIEYSSHIENLLHKIK